MSLSIINYISSIFLNNTIDYFWDKYILILEYKQDLLLEVNKNNLEYKYSTFKAVLIISILINIMQYINSINEYNYLHKTGYNLHKN
jgi:hypothetical protein